MPGYELTIDYVMIQALYNNMYNIAASARSPNTSAMCQISDEVHITLCPVYDMIWYYELLFWIHFEFLMTHSHLGYKLLNLFYQHTIVMEGVTLGLNVASSIYLDHNIVYFLIRVDLSKHQEEHKWAQLLIRGTPMVKRSLASSER